jgi:hypothetical protein
MMFPHLDLLLLGSRAPGCFVFSYGAGELLFGSRACSRYCARMTIDLTKDRCWGRNVP